ncbi:septation protein SepH [Flindersiella endophytica]
MRDVKLVRLSEDGTHLVLAHEGTGEEFALRIDDRVRGAVVSDRARIGQLPMERPSRLRPKEIQARLRAGESSEDIAAAADVPLERILRYAGPVLAEREYIAEQARRCALRRQPGGTAGKTLEQVAGDRLEALGLDLERAEWDAWRAPDGRWAVSVKYALDGEQQRAVFSYDPLGRLVVPSDDAAREMVEGPKEQPATSTVGPSVVHGPGPRTPRDGRLRLAPVPPPEAAPEVYAGDPDTGHSADVRQLRPATPPTRPQQPAARHHDLTEADLEAIDSEDTVDLSRTLNRQPGQLRPFQAPQQTPPSQPERQPEPVRNGGAEPPVLRAEPRREPEPERQPEPARNSGEPPVLRAEPRREPEPERQPEAVPELLDAGDLAEPEPAYEPEPEQAYDYDQHAPEPILERQPEPVTPAPAPRPAGNDWLPEEILEEVRAEPAPKPVQRVPEPEPVAEPESEPELEPEPAPAARRQEPEPEPEPEPAPPVVEERPAPPRVVPTPPAKRPVPAPPPGRRPAPTVRDAEQPAAKAPAPDRPAAEPRVEEPVAEQPVKEAAAKATSKPAKPVKAAPKPAEEKQPEPEPKPAEVAAAAEPETAPEPEAAVRRPKPANANAQRKRAARSSRRKGGAVPSWDDILFGGGKK